MQIGELAKRSGASVRSLRHYEAVGLIRADRRENGYRRFSPEMVGRVQQVRALLASGLTTAEILQLAPCFGEGEGGAPLCPAAQARYHQKLAEIDEQIAHLQRLRQQIIERLAGAQGESP